MTPAGWPGLERLREVPERAINEKSALPIGHVYPRSTNLAGQHSKRTIQLASL